MRIFPLILLFSACAPTPKPRVDVAQEPFALSAQDNARDEAKPTLSSMSESALNGDRHQAAITFFARRVRAPVVRGSVHGKSTFMLLDTGASHHFVADWMVHRIFSDDVNQTATDHVGRAVKTTRLDQPQIKLDSWGMLADTPAMILADGNESSDLGVTLSPQQIAGDGAIVLDFPHGVMSSANSRDDAERNLPRGAALPTAQKCGGVYFLSAKIGDANADLLLDTGAAFTDLRPQSAAARALTLHAQDGQGQSMGAGGAIDWHRLPKVPIIAGQVHATVDIVLLDHASNSGACRIDGVLGMDVLQKCVLVVDGASITGKCTE